MLLTETPVRKLRHSDSSTAKSLQDSSECVYKLMVKKELDPTADTEDPSPKLEKQHFFSAMSCVLILTNMNGGGE